MFAGPSVDRHHLVPKSRGGRHMIWLHRVCHKKIHSVFTEKELARSYSTLDALRAHEEIQKFIIWIRNKDPEFVARHQPQKRGRRR